MVYFTGFADEAGADLDTQIAATKAIGWEFIESRNIDGKNIHDISDEAFDVVVGKLQDSGVKINCFGSAIANWGKSVADPFEITLEEMNRAIPRMQRIGCKLIRIMSYKVIGDVATDDQMEEERFRRLREMLAIFTDAGITPVHENCMNYGGMGWYYTLKMVENVPGLKLVYDTGNPIFTHDYIKGEPYPKQSAWEFYEHVKEHIAYIHIKDGIWDKENSKSIFTFPGEGDGDVVKIVNDLVKSGYDGGFSMEPHMAVVFHDDKVQSESEIRFNNYVEYGKRFMKIVDLAKNK
jgi:sugar phosphate isomerase/epimerase